MTYDEEYHDNWRRLSAPVAMAKERSIGVCAADIKAKCAGIKPGGGRIKDCVKTHAGEFSDACKARLSRRS
jgi:hypothetical protein